MADNIKTVYLLNKHLIKTVDMEDNIKTVYFMLQKSKLFHQEVKDLLSEMGLLTLHSCCLSCILDNF